MGACTSEMCVSGRSDCKASIETDTIDPEVDFQNVTLGDEHHRAAEPTGPASTTASQSTNPIPEADTASNVLNLPIGHDDFQEHLGDSQPAPGTSWEEPPAAPFQSAQQVWLLRHYVTHIAPFVLQRWSSLRIEQEADRPNSLISSILVFTLRLMFLVVLDQIPRWRMLFWRSPRVMSIALCQQEGSTTLTPIATIRLAWKD